MGVDGELGVAEVWTGNKQRRSERGCYNNGFSGGLLLLLLFLVVSCCSFLLSHFLVFLYSVSLISLCFL